MMSQTQTVLCLGDSITRGVYSFDWVSVLRRKRPEFRFVNAGRDGELAYNARLRVDKELNCRPDVVLVALGANDVNALTSDYNTRRAVKLHRLPQTPSLEWYAENMLSIVARVRELAPAARLALMSPPVLGEDLANVANRMLPDYCAALRQIARDNGASYLPLHEQMRAFLAATPPPVAPPPLDKGIRRARRAALRHILLRQSWDKISGKYGLRLTTDNIHLNSAGGMMAADLVEGFLLKEPSRL
jgi:lysophospholipase L1-like esterase